MTAPLFHRAIPLAAEYEIRTADNGARTFTGYAAVFNADSEPLPFVETIQPGAFTRSLNGSREHTFVIDHDDTKLLSSRRAGTLKLTEDSKGLLVESELPRTSYANDLVELHDRGEARSMSFTFRVVKGRDGAGEMWSQDGKRRTLTNVALGHVSVLTGLPPAYRQTTASIRSLAYRLGAEADDLAEAVEALRNGDLLSPAQLALIEQAARTLGTNPADLPTGETDDRPAAPGDDPVTTQPGIPIAVRQYQLALASKAR